MTFFPWFLYIGILPYILNLLHHVEFTQPAHLLIHIFDAIYVLLVLFVDILDIGQPEIQNSTTTISLDGSLYTYIYFSLFNYLRKTCDPSRLRVSPSSAPRHTRSQSSHSYLLVGLSWLCSCDWICLLVWVWWDHWGGLLNRSSRWSNILASDP